MSLALRQPLLGLGLGLVSKFSVLGAQDLGKTETEKTAESHGDEVVGPGDSEEGRGLAVGNVGGRAG